MPLLLNMGFLKSLLSPKALASSRLRLSLHSVRCLFHPTRAKEPEWTCHLGCAAPSLWEEGSSGRIPSQLGRGLPRGGTWAPLAGPRPLPAQGGGLCLGSAPFSLRARVWWSQAEEAGCQSPCSRHRRRHRGARTPFRLGVLWSYRISGDIPTGRAGSRHGRQGLSLLPHG